MSFKNAKIVAAGVDADAYHRQEGERGTLDWAMSPSYLKSFWSCPSRWKKGVPDKPSTAKRWGNIMDTLVLTPEKFQNRYAVTPENYVTTGFECPMCKSVTDSKTCRSCKCERVQVSIEKPWSANASECKQWIQEHAGKEFMTKQDSDKAAAAATVLRSNATVAAFLDTSEKQVLAVGEWHDNDTGLVIPVRCLLDLVPRLDSEFSTCLGDMKTTACAAPVPFQRQIHKFGWHVQAAFDLDLFVAATGQDRNTWCLIGQENFEPWEPFARILRSIDPGNFMDLGRRDYRRMLSLYAQCIKRNEWPSYDDNEDALNDGKYKWGVSSSEPYMDPETCGYSADRFTFTEDAEQSAPESDDFVDIFA